MRVCAMKDPFEDRLPTGQRALCWLHGPASEIPEGGDAPLERRELAVSEEA